ncbi:hypothetical protein FRACA_1180007 [Frankia canadensis]|uniref:PKD domain-containing protein n=1 Tax=Frankia canadensis TaxID=1836972 RepID=A0A2I2KJR3_9ACTN|nr:hypothetical protein [Frankia canadensis]SNQ45909.1 hypothetical protein FRACA_1180007 [Frankia canadensis]SOU53199.1 hypothetical protein FRACA_1180007 [Frankia canadensis]
MPAIGQAAGERPRPIFSPARILLILLLLGWCAVGCATTSGDPRRPVAPHPDVEWPRDRSILTGEQPLRVRLPAGDRGQSVSWQVDDGPTSLLGPSPEATDLRTTVTDVTGWNRLGRHLLRFYLTPPGRPPILIKTVPVYSTQVRTRLPPSARASEQAVEAWLEGVPADLYAATWRVDGGQFNAMRTDTAGHKTYTIDTGGWSWRTAGYYAVRIDMTERGTSRQIAGPAQIILFIPPKPE